MPSSAGGLTLYSHVMCPFAQKAWIALNFAKVDYEIEQIDLYGSKPSWFLKMNPKGQVPVLKVGDEVITESEDILSFIGSDQLVDSRLEKPDHESDVLYWREIVDSRLKVVGKKAVLSRAGLGKNSELGEILQEMDQKYSANCNGDSNVAFLVGGNPSVAGSHTYKYLNIHSHIQTYAHTYIHTYIHTYRLRHLSVPVSIECRV